MSRPLGLDRAFFRYGVYYPVLLARGEWFLPYLRDLRRTQFLPPEELQALQLARLNRLLDHAALAVPYYADRIPRTVTSLEALRELPLLDKQTLRANASSLRSRQYRRGARVKTSGGSTGAPVTVLKSRRAFGRELAAAWRGYGWAGISIGDRQARFWGVPMTAAQRRRMRLIDFMGHRVRLSAFNLTEEAIAAHIERLARFRPDYLYGYVSILREVARHVLRRGRPSGLAPRAAITTSEVLGAPDRRLIGEAFDCPVFDEYGCGEVGTIAHECEAGSLHINAENVFVEVVDPDGRALGPGTQGEIVVTELNNLAMPLIRYRLADFATIGTDSCACGRTLPTLMHLFGRQYDSLKNLRGELFHGEFFLYMLEDLLRQGVHVAGCQFVQPVPQRLEVRLVTTSQNLEAAAYYLRRALRDRFDSGVTVDIIPVDQIAREPSGKLRVVKRNFE